MTDRLLEADWLELSEILRTTGQPQAIDRRGQNPAPPVPRSSVRVVQLGLVEDRWSMPIVGRQSTSIRVRAIISRTEDDRTTALGFLCGYADSNQGALSTGLRRTSNAPISRRSSVTRGSVRWMLLLVGDTTITNTSPTQKFRSCAFAICR